MSGERSEAHPYGGGCPLHRCGDLDAIARRLIGHPDCGVAEFLGGARHGCGQSHVSHRCRRQSDAGAPQLQEGGLGVRGARGRRGGRHNQADAPVRRHERQTTLRPGKEPPLQAVGSEAAGPEDVGGFQASRSSSAHRDNRTPVVNLAETPGEFVERNVAGSLDPARLPFVGMAHVDKFDIVLPVEKLLHVHPRSSFLFGR